jgi:membrane protein YdbS with pleckstrin-like domain
MANKPQLGKKGTGKARYVHLKKLSAGVALLAFVVVVLVCFMAGTSVFTMACRALVVMLVIGVVTRVIIKILATYEEMNRGKA